MPSEGGRVRILHAWLLPWSVPSLYLKGNCGPCYRGCSSAVLRTEVPPTRAGSMGRAGEEAKLKKHNPACVSYGRAHYLEQKGYTFQHSSFPCSFHVPRAGGRGNEEFCQDSGVGTECLACSEMSVCFLSQRPGAAVYPQRFLQHPG